ncbi:hypothetical protein AAMO2058_001070500 [Amorphochlora amoebiformis]|uniref:Calmodulin n=1 Tax=Amorphochlora amoebiformis TaxID=1561963 RepID=A0A7S0DTC2_9EUKA|mmetsp:Transcript_5902/g.9053  ORF Transcript_5902/g.9053 Transcript_5902/m.9053 type:complete len:628 (+) Transcript_5902:14-1897(+)
MGACGSTGENTERKKLKEDDLPEENRSKKYADNKAESQPSNVPVTEPGPVATKNQMLAPVKEKEKEKQTEKKAIQDEGNKLDDNKRIFMDTPLKLPPELPGLNREKSIWVLGDKSKAKAPKNDYTFIKRLGNPGQFGEAWRCIRKKDGTECAVKKIAKARFMSDPRRATKYLTAFSAEIQIMERIDHKYCIKFHEAFEDSNYLYMAMELCTGGELFDRIIEKKKHTEHEAADTLYMLFQGLEYIHHHGLAHCDLKPDNFLFLDKSPNSPIKIIDFGMAKPVHPHQYHKQFCGTPYYVAPEIINQRGYNLSCDMWSMGVIMFLMLFGYPPFHSRKKKEGNAGHREIFEKIKKGFEPVVRKGYGPWFPTHVKVSSEARDLMARLMEMDTSKRITADEALNHPWFTKSKDLDTELDGRVLASLKDFRKAGKFKHMLLGALAGLNDPDSKLLDDQEEKMLMDVLSHLDENRDGYVSVAELQKALNSTMCRDEILRITKLVDITGDEQISIEELSMVYLDRKISAKEERLWHAFTNLDITGNMKLSIDDIKKALKAVKGVSYTEEEIESAFRQADLDGNGHIDYDEFLYLWGSKNAPPRPNSEAHRMMSSRSSKDRLEIKSSRTEPREAKAT